MVSAPSTIPDGIAGSLRELAPPQPGSSHLDTYDNPPSMWPDFLVGQINQPVRVLLVDNDAHMHRVIAQELMRDGRTLLVAQAGSVREGRKAMRQAEFDVMLVDLHLPDGEGYELLDYRKTVRPSAEAVVLSLVDAEDQAIRAFELGASGYLVKNSWFGNYTQAVLQVANGGACISPNVARQLLHRFEQDQSPMEKHRQHASERLSTREREVLRMVASGLTSAEIGGRLLISSMTVNTHVRNIYRKLQVHTRAQAVRFASVRGLF